MPSLAYDLPAAIPRCPSLAVAIDGRPVAIGQTPVAAYGVCAVAGAAEIEIVAPSDAGEAQVSPLSRGITVIRDGNRFRLRVDEPGSLTITIPGQPVLHLFVQPLEQAEPARDDASVVRLESGRIHELGEVPLRTGQTLWIEGGAVLRGRVIAEGVANVRIAGHGIIDGSVFPHHAHRTVLLYGCTDSVVEGVTIIGAPSWTVVLAACDRVAVRRINLIGWVVCSDGIDVVGSRDVLIEDCFLRDNDDCVVVKALDLDGRTPKAMRDVERVLVQRCVCWNDHAGNVFEIGFETRCGRISGIVFRDCDVLGAHGEGGVLTIHAGDRALIEDVLYEDIRVEHYYDKFIDFRVLHSRYSQDAERGRIRNVTVRRVTTIADRFNIVSLLGGYDADHLVEGIRLEDVRIGDRVLARIEDLHLFTRFARDVTVAASPAAVAAAR